MGPNAFPFWSKQSKRGNLKYWHFASTTCRQCLQLAGRVYLWCTVSTEPRPPTPYMRVNDCSGPFWGKGAFGPLPKYWHFASTTCRQCLQLAGRVYLWCTVSTDPRPPTPYMRVNDCSGPFWGKGAEYWHFASTTCRQCLQLAGHVYLWCTVSTDPRPPSPSVRVNDGSGPFWGKGAFGPLPKYWHFASTTCRQCLQLAGRVYLWCTVSTDPRPPTPYMRVNVCSGPFWGKGAEYWHFASTTCRQCLQLAGHVYLWCTVSTDPRPPSPSVRVNDGSGPFWGKGAFGPLRKYWHFASTTCRQCLQLAGRVYLWCTVSTDPRPPSPSMRVNDGSGPYIYIHIYVVRHSTTRRTVSYCVVLCRTVSYNVVLCRTVSYCVVQCRTVSYCVVLCRTSVVRHCTTRRTVSYSVVQCRTVSYSVVQCRTSVVRHCTTRRTVSYKVSGPDASGMYDASYSVVQGVGARRVGDVRRVGRCRGPTRRKIPTSTVVESRGQKFGEFGSTAPAI